MEQPIAIIGYGGHGAVVVEILRLSGRSIIGYYDRRPRRNDPFDLVYLGDERNVANAGLSGASLLICIGDNQRRQELSEWAVQKGLSVALAAIHPRASVSMRASIGLGSMVGAQAVVNVGATIGCGVILNTSSIIEHDCTVGDYSHVAPGAKVLGEVSIGKGCLIGSGSVILPGIEVGDRVTVGAGAVVTKNVPSGMTVKGIPARG